MGKLKKALDKVRKQADKAKKTTAAAEDAASRALIGRTNFSKVLTADDPMILRSFKALQTKRPMRVVKDVEELVNGTSDSSMPFVMRKGRGLAKLLIKDAALRGHLEATVQEFCKVVESGKEGKSMSLASRRLEVRSGSI